VEKWAELAEDCCYPDLATAIRLAEPELWRSEAQLAEGCSDVQSLFEETCDAWFDVHVAPLVLAEAKENMDPHAHDRMDKRKSAILEQGPRKSKTGFSCHQGISRTMIDGFMTATATSITGGSAYTPMEGMGMMDRKSVDSVATGPWAYLHEEARKDVVDEDTDGPLSPLVDEEGLGEASQQPRAASPPPSIVVTQVPSGEEAAPADSLQEAPAGGGGGRGLALAPAPPHLQDSLPPPLPRDKEAASDLSSAEEDQKEEGGKPQVAADDRRRSKRKSKKKVKNKAPIAQDKKEEEEEVTLLHPEGWPQKQLVGPQVPPRELSDSEEEEAAATPQLARGLDDGGGEVQP